MKPTILHDFAAKAAAEQNSFTLADAHGLLHFFVPTRAGAATLIFHSDGYTPDFYLTAEHKLTLAAAVKDGIVYLLDSYSLGAWGVPRENWPENMTTFAFLKTRCNLRATELWRKFYDALPAEPSDDSDLPQKARASLIAGEAKLEALETVELFTADDALRLLCGTLDLNSEATARLEADRARWTRTKSRALRLVALLQAPDTLTEAEREIAAGLRAVDAKTVTVEFERENRTAAGKIEAATLRRILAENSSFSAYDFTTATGGKKLLAALGIQDPRQKLTCRDIAKITYGKKTLYARAEQAEQNQAAARGETKD